jgi:tetratricopeptide (TPR) repeat protein
LLVRRNIEGNISENVRKELLKYVMKFCSCNLKAAILETAQSVCCLYRLMELNTRPRCAALKSSAVDVRLQTTDGESLERKCPFCRHPLPKSQADIDLGIKKRAESNCPVALRWMGDVYYTKGDYGSAFQYYTKAAGLNNAQAHYELSHMYYDGRGVEKDTKMENYHLEEAAIGGHPEARYNLGVNAGKIGNIKRAVKHHIIAASLGDGDAVSVLKKGCRVGQISKEDFAAALRAHQAAIDATKSPQREVADSAEFLKF